MEPLRIIHVLSHNQCTRGGAIQALLIATAQQDAGHEVTVLYHNDPNRPLHASFGAWAERGMKILPFHQNRLSELLRFRALIKRHRPHVVHAHREKSAFFVWLATAFLPLPVFVSQRGTTKPIHTWYLGMALRSPRMHRVIAVAEAVKRQLVSERLPDRKVEVVYGSFDVDRFDPSTADRAKLRDELGLDDDQKLVVQVGELHSKKSPRTFIRVGAEILKRRDDVVFALVGKGNRERQCRREIELLGVGDRVKMVGFRTDIPDVYAASDIAVNCSSRFEGLTGAIREALAMAKPVVATKTDGNPEVVRHEQTGLLVPVGDIGAMAAAVERLLDDDEKARTYGAAGRRLVLELMHPDVRLKRMMSVYESVLGENASESSSAQDDSAARVHSSSRAIAPASDAAPSASRSASGTTPKV